MTIALAALFNDVATAPISQPVVQVLAFPKRELKDGTLLVGISGYHAYGVAENAGQFRAENCVPMDLLDNFTVLGNVPKDEVITTDHVKLTAHTWLIN